MESVKTSVKIFRNIINAAYMEVCTHQKCYSNETKIMLDQLFLFANKYESWEEIRIEIEEPF